MARARNRPPRLVGLIVVAVLILLAVLCARAAADPVDTSDGDGGEIGTASRDGDSASDGGAAAYGGPIVGAYNAPAATRRRWWRGAPPLAVTALVRAAYRAAGLEDDPTSGWRWRARVSGLVPWVSTRVGRDDTWREVEDPTLGHSVVFDVRATWHLDRLLFDPNEIRISAIDVSRRRERRRVAATTIHAYYLWLATGSEEVHAELDADTDGWFSEALANAEKPR